MNLWKRALLYTMRKKGKTVILFLVLFVMSTFVLTGLAIRSAADRSAGELRKSVGGSIKLKSSGSLFIFGHDFANSASISPMASSFFLLIILAYICVVFTSVWPSSLQTV